MPCRRFALAVALSLLPVVLPAQDDPSLIGHTSGLFGAERCPPTGKTIGSDISDPYLNALKNRDMAPDSYKHTTIAAILADVPAASEAGKRRRDKWTDTQRKSLVKKETTGIEVIGYLAGVALQDPESCNCGDPVHRDYHMWVVAHTQDKQAKAVVVELTPRLMESHPNWHKLASKAWHGGDLVRIRGWLTWDQEHPELLHSRTTKKGKLLHATRGTLWEVHPVLEIDVKDAKGKWVAIDGGA
ncbi:MAG TPA: hypothetical protein VF713_02960 [Thermoanaerobaculia bacterium]